MNHISQRSLKPFSLLLTVALLFLLPPGLLAEDSTEPIDQIRQSVSQVVAIMTDPALASEEHRQKRRDKVIAVVDQRFNFELMAKLALGKEWEKIGPNFQKKFSGLFAELLKNTYMRRVEAYSDEQVQFSDQVIKKNVAMVRSLFIKNNAGLSIVYKLRKEGSQWLVYDVIIEGASIIKQYRSQFATILKKEKIGGLIGRLEEKVAALEQI